jgi:hypothetical protein
LLKETIEEEYMKQYIHPDEPESMDDESEDWLISLYTRHLVGDGILNYSLLASGILWHCQKGSLC